MAKELVVFLHDGGTEVYKDFTEARVEYGVLFIQREGNKQTVINAHHWDKTVFEEVGDS